MFAPPPPELIEHSTRFDCYLGGAESNVAIGLARLGERAGWVSKLPRNALGRKIVNEMRAYGVDTSAVCWTDGGRVGTFFFEFATSPRTPAFIYDRAGSAMTTLSATDLDWDYLRQAEWLQLTGITPGLSPVCRQTVREILHRAKELGLKICFDVNYRALLWPPAEARSALTPLLPDVDLLVTTEADAAVLLGGEFDRREALRQLLDSTARQAVVMTLGGEGCLAYNGEAFLSAPGYDIQVVNRLGAGDAFVAGLLHGCLHGGLETGLRYGAAMAALKMTIPQNTPLVLRDDVERLLSGRPGGLIR